MAHVFLNFWKYGSPSSTRRCKLPSYASRVNFESIILAAALKAVAHFSAFMDTGAWAGRVHQGHKHVQIYAFHANDGS